MEPSAARGEDTQRRQRIVGALDGGQHIECGCGGAASADREIGLSASTREGGEVVLVAIRHLQHGRTEGVRKCFGVPGCEEFPIAAFHHGDDSERWLASRLQQ